ncbi:MAG: efflux RND transporter periplasmic adaptor subunit [Deltaproteobacteria bacterium]|jgi:multidrug efflux system membrane fusion protein|nr:efflux RND transporter periplasmic adaptor subunit [Deltaproteobacteria bacterium]
MRRTLLCLFITLGLFCAACSDDGASSRAGRSKAVPVRVAKVKTEEVRRTLSVVGHVEPSATVHITAQVGGQLMEAHVRPGSYVHAGDTLFILDRRPFQNALLQAEAALSSNRAQLRRAQQDLNRYKQLASQNFLSQQQYEQSLTEVETLQANIAQNTAARENAQLQLGHATIKAPISGRAGEVLVHPGNNVKANDSTLLVINTVSPAEVRFAVPERFLPELNRRLRTDRVETLVLPEGDTGEPVSGLLTLIDNEVDKNTGTISMRARFANSEERLWPGQFVRVSIVMESVSDALVIPAGAVLEGLSGRYAYVLGEDGRVSPRDIKIMDLSDGRGMVEQGLALGESVVIDGQLNLMPGSLVEIIAPAAGEETDPARAGGEGSGKDGGPL